jgi:oligopeptide transport system permease protein
MRVSFKVGIIATVVEVGLGYPAGILMAKYKDGIFDRIGKAYIISIDAIPGVAYYYLWVVILCSWIHLPRAYNADNPLSLLAPALTLGFTGMAGIALWVRRFMLDEFNSDYVKFARAKGLSENRILYTHVLRNAIVPLIRSIPAAILGALLGTFYIEKIYGINGIGGYMIQAIDKTNNDFYALQGIIIISALISVVSYLLGDIVTAVVDPRVSFSEE